MANIETNENKQLKIVIISLLMLCLAVFSIFYFRLNLGTDFAGSSAVVFQLDHKIPTDNIVEIAGRLFPLSEINSTITDKYYLSYQNVTSDNLISIISYLKQEIGGILDISYYAQSYQMEYFLYDRLNIIAGGFVLLGAVYYALSLRSKGLKRGEALEFAVSEIISGIFGIILLFGFVGFFGALGVIMDNEFFALMMLAVGVLFITRIYLLAKTADFIVMNNAENIDTAMNSINKKYWPEIVFITVVIAIIVVLPLFMLGIDILAGGLLVIYGLLVALFNQAYLSPVLFLNLKRIINYKRSSFLNKKW